MTRTDSENKHFMSIWLSVNRHFTDKSHGTSHPGFLFYPGPPWLDSFPPPILSSLAVRPRTCKRGREAAGNRGTPGQGCFDGRRMDARNRLLDPRKLPEACLTARTNALVRVFFHHFWWWLLLSLSLFEQWCSNCVWNSLVFSYLASMSGVVCVVCAFADDEKLKNIHVDLALLVWGPALLRTHAPLPP